MNRQFTSLLLCFLVMNGCCDTTRDHKKVDYRSISDLQYIISVIDVPNDAENDVAELYDHFLKLIANNEMSNDTHFSSNKRFCKKNETHTIFEWSYYISPNELRGFEISIPANFLDCKESGYVTNTTLVVDTIIQKQMITIVTMKQKQLLK